MFLEKLTEKQKKEIEKSLSKLMKTDVQIFYNESFLEYNLKVYSDEFTLNDFEVKMYDEKATICFNTHMAKIFGDKYIKESKKYLKKSLDEMNYNYKAELSGYITESKQINTNYLKTISDRANYYSNVLQKLNKSYEKMQAEEL